MQRQKVSIYKIKNVDTLSTIAQKFNVNPTEILITNQISPKQIFEGNIIYFSKKD